MGALNVGRSSKLQVSDDTLENFDVNGEYSIEELMQLIQASLDLIKIGNSTLQLKPNADEVPVTKDTVSQYSMGVERESEQNVRFVDTHPGFTHEAPGEFDAVRDHAMIDDATLQDFFSRPVKIKSKIWQIGAAASSFQETFNPWTLFFEDPKVINRISNYRLLRCKLHIKCTISGTPFHYGLAMVDYNPLGSIDTVTAVRSSAYKDADYVIATQRPHIFLDPTESQGGEMVLPFFYHKNALDISASAWQEMGDLTISQFSTLKTAASTLTDVTVNVFAWAEDVKFAVPTGIQPSTLVAQADEHQIKPVSYVAGVVAASAKALSSIPPIAPFARATEIGARAVGALATLFGYSRPVMLESSMYRPRTKADFAVTNAHDDCTKLSVDLKQELSIDPRLAGLESIDEMSISYIASKESYVDSFTWTSAQSTETRLAGFIVDPMQHRESTEGAEIGHHLTATAFAALPFKFWRGSLKFRFKVVCSKYHRGRLKFVYDPVASSPTVGYNEAYTTIIDIAETKDFVITVGWGQPTTYREVKGPTSSVVYSSHDTRNHSWGNGTLSVYVVNELVEPDAVADIEVKCFISAGDDFEVAVPDDTFIRRTRFTNQLLTLKPNALEREHVVPSDPPVEDTMASLTSLTDNTNLVYMGEHIRSMRQMAKRYTYARTLRHDVPLTASTRHLRRYVLEVFPPHAQHYDTASELTVTNASGDHTLPGIPTMLSYIASAYGGWRGSVRWIYDFSNSSLADTPAYSVKKVQVGNYHIAASERLFTYDIEPLTTDVNMIAFTNEMRHVTGTNGICVENINVQPMVNVEIPYYSQFRFTPAKVRHTPGTNNIYMPMMTCNYAFEYRSSENHVDLYCAAGEDFTVFFYLGPPIMYFIDDYT